MFQIFIVLGFLYLKSYDKTVSAAHAPKYSIESSTYNIVIPYMLNCNNRVIMLAKSKCMPMV